MKPPKLSARRVVQLLAAALMNGYALGFRRGTIFTGSSKALCVPVLNCYSCPGALGACPIGALQTALGGVKAHVPFYVLGLLLLFGVVLGRMACGLLCPFGLVQDLVHKLPLPKWRVPKKLDRAGRRVKYGVLVLFVAVLPLMAAKPCFCEYLCPAGTLEGGIPLLLADPALRGLAGTLFQWKVLVLAVILLAAAVIPRPFCRYLCPLGAFYALFHRFQLFQLHWDEAACTRCKACERACPMAVEITETIHSGECIHCGTCRKVCPQGAIAVPRPTAQAQRKGGHPS